jgi:hypothetical protein
MSFLCQTGVSAPIEVEAVPEELREGTHHALDALQVTSNAGAESVEATLTLELTPRLKVSTEDLQIDESGKSTFEIENVGEGTLRVQVVPLQDWIAVNRRDWTIKAGKKARVRVTVSDVPAEGTSGVELRTPTEIRQLLVGGG